MDVEIGCGIMNMTKVRGGVGRTGGGGWFSAAAMSGLAAAVARVAAWLWQGRSADSAATDGLHRDCELLALQRTRQQQQTTASPRLLSSSRCLLRWDRKCEWQMACGSECLLQCAELVVCCIPMLHMYVHSLLLRVRRMFGSVQSQLSSSLDILHAFHTAPAAAAAAAISPLAIANAIAFTSPTAAHSLARNVDGRGVDCSSALLALLSTERAPPTRSLVRVHAVSDLGYRRSSSFAMSLPRINHNHRLH